MNYKYIFRNLSIGAILLLLSGCTPEFNEAMQSYNAQQNAYIQNSNQRLYQQRQNNNWYNDFQQQQNRQQDFTRQLILNNRGYR